MKLTTKGRYAVTALVDMAIHGQNRPVTVKELADRQSIPQPYLEQLTGLLRAKGILVSLKGPGGGYIFAQSLDKITVADIISAVNEPVDSTRCKGKHNCQQGTMCLTHSLWEELNMAMHTFLQNKSLEDLVKTEQIHKVAIQQKVTQEKTIKINMKENMGCLI